MINNKQLAVEAVKGLSQVLLGLLHEVAHSLQWLLVLPLEDVIGQSKYLGN